MYKILAGCFLLLISCPLQAQTQAEMNRSALDQFNKADRELNRVYHKILKEYSSDTAFVTSFRKAQRIWVQLRDAEMQAMYPEREAGYYGSIQPLCWHEYKRELTEERIKKLTQWLTGREEDSCSPTIKSKGAHSPVPVP